MAEFGTPRKLPLSGGWIIQREIPGFPDRDASGCYPLFCCRDWSQLHTDLGNIHDLVSLVVVVDPFSTADEILLRRSFMDVAMPFKEHYVVDLTIPIESIASAHHRKYSRKALQRLEIQVVVDPIQLVDEWTSLYGHLAKAMNLTGIKAFSRRAFELQLGIPGLVMFRAVSSGSSVSVGTHLWYRQGDVAYFHLAALAPEGYALNASYALIWTAIEHFRGRASWLDFGGAAGTSEDRTDGLSWFKHGWSSGTRTAWLCGRIFLRDRYDRIAKSRGSCSSSYFPAYRSDEFAGPHDDAGTRAGNSGSTTDNR